MSKPAAENPAKIFSAVMVSGIWRELPLTAQSVYAAHIVVADKDTLKHSWAVENIAHLLNLKPRTVQVANKILDQKGLITRTWDGHHKTAVTTLLPCRLPRKTWRITDDSVAHGGAPQNDDKKGSVAHDGALCSAPSLHSVAHGGAPNPTYKDPTDNILLIKTPAGAGGGGTSPVPKPPSKGKAVKTSDGVQTAVIKCFSERWRERYRRKFQFLPRHARDFEGVCNALGRDLPACQAAVDRFIASNDKFIVSNSHRPEEFISRLNSFTADSPTNGDGTFKETSNANSIILNRE